MGARKEKGPLKVPQPGSVETGLGVEETPPASTCVFPVVLSESTETPGSQSDPGATMWPEAQYLPTAGPSFQQLLPTLAAPPGQNIHPMRRPSTARLSCWQLGA